jgi:hypothetical protein
MALYQEAMRVQAFQREPSALFGYVIKAALAAREDSREFKEPWNVGGGAIMTRQEYSDALVEACTLWKHVM